jgi:hypothetical protein
MRTYKRKGIRKIKKHTRKYFKNKKRGGTNEMDVNKVVNKLIPKDVIGLNEFYTTSTIIKPQNPKIEGGGDSLKRQKVWKEHNNNQEFLVTGSVGGLVRTLSTLTDSEDVRSEPRIDALQKIQQIIDADPLKNPAIPHGDPGHSPNYDRFMRSFNSHGIVQEIINMGPNPMLVMVPTLNAYTISSYAGSFGNELSQRYKDDDPRKVTTAQDANALSPEFSLGPTMVARFYNCYHYVKIKHQGLEPDYIAGIKHLVPLNSSLCSATSPFASNKTGVWGHLINAELGGGRGSNGNLDGRPCTGYINGRWYASIEAKFKILLGAISLGRNRAGCIIQVNHPHYGLVEAKLGVIYSCVVCQLDYNTVRGMLGLHPLNSNGAFPQGILDNPFGLCPAYRASFHFCDVLPGGNIELFDAFAEDDEGKRRYPFLDDVIIDAFKGDCIIFEQIPDDP